MNANISNITLSDVIRPDPTVVEYLSQTITQAIEDYGLYHEVNSLYCIQSIRSYIRTSMEVIEYLYPEIHCFQYELSYHFKARKFIITPKNTYAVRACTAMNCGRRWFIEPFVGVI